MVMIEKKITDEMEQAFIDAAHSPHEQVTEAVVAGLVAFMAIVERDYVVVPRRRCTRELDVESTGAPMEDICDGLIDPASGRCRTCGRSA